MTQPYQRSEILQTLMPILEGIFAKSSNITKYNREIDKFIDINNEALNHNTPTYKVVYNIDWLYEMLDITDQTIEDIKKDIKYKVGMASNQAASNDRYILLTTLLYYFKSEHKRAAVEHTLMYFTLVIYSALYKKYYKYPPNDNIMQYTINRITNRYYFKRYGTVFKAIYAVAEQNDQTMQSSLMKKDDNELMKYIISLYSRLNNQMNSFAKEFYLDQKSKNYLNQSIDNTTDDNSFDDPKNISFTVTAVTNKNITKFSQSPISNKVAKTAAGIAHISPVVLKQTMGAIKNNDVEAVRILINNIVSLYLNDKNNQVDSIGSQKFIAYALKIYGRNNAKDEQLIQLKNTMGSLLEKYSPKYNQTARVATKSNYRKSIYLYIVFLICENS